MKKLDAFEKDLLAAYEAGELKSTSPTKRDLNKGHSYKFPMKSANGRGCCALKIDS